MLRGSPARPPARSQGRWLFSCACNTLRVWDMARAIPRCVHTVTLDKGDILSLVASKDRVYAANADGSLRCGGGSRVGGRVLGSTHPPCIISGRPPACRDGRREGGSKRRAPFPGRSSAARSKCSARRGSGPALQRSSGPVASFCTAWGGAGGGQRARGRRCGSAAGAGGGISPRVPNPPVLHLLAKLDSAAANPASTAFPFPSISSCPTGKNYFGLCSAPYSTPSINPAPPPPPPPPNPQDVGHWQEGGADRAGLPAKGARRPRHRHCPAQQQLALLGWAPGARVGDGDGLMGCLLCSRRLPTRRHPPAFGRGGRSARALRLAARLGYMTLHGPAIPHSPSAPPLAPAPVPAVSYDGSLKAWDANSLDLVMAAPGVRGPGWPAPFWAGSSILAAPPFSQWRVVLACRGGDLDGARGPQRDAERC